MTKKPKPQLPLTPVGIKITRNHQVAIYYTITFMDMAGRLWKLEKADMVHDLHPDCDQVFPSSDAPAS